MPPISGWLASAPVSITPTIAPAPVVTFQAEGKFSRLSHHWSGVPAGVPGSCPRRPGSLGVRRSSRLYSTETLFTAGSRRSSAMACGEPFTVATPS